MLLIGKKKISKNVRVLEKEFEIANGLMFKKKLLSDEAYYFKLPYPSKWDVHMLFVFQTIDLVFGRDNKVMELKQNLKPFRFYRVKNEVDTLIELPGGRIAQKKISLGESIRFTKKKAL